MSDEIKAEQSFEKKGEKVAVICQQRGCCEGNGGMQ
jgi:hypothetical protein